MKSLKAKLVVLLITMLLFTMLVPFSRVAAANEGVQLIKVTDETGNENIVIYVDGLEKEAFDYALAGENADEGDKTFIKSELDNSDPEQVEEANQVAVISANDLTAENNYLYIRKSDGSEIKVELDVNKDTMFTQEKMSLVENTTKRILTTEAKDLASRTEERDGITYTYKVGGLQITDEDQTAEYSYVMAKLPAEGYSELRELADELNSDYASKTMYSKIEFANRFYNQYNALIKNADNENSWQPVEDMQIVQPEDYNEQEH